jgi:hypothetical protein
MQKFSQQPERILAGELVDESINFKFQVMAYRPLSPQELNFAYNFWNSQRDKRLSLKDKVVTAISNTGRYH